MNLLDFAHSPLSLLPPIVALTLAIFTRRVLVSLGVGIVLGAFLLNNGSIDDSFSYVREIGRAHV